VSSEFKIMSVSPLAPGYNLMHTSPVQKVWRTC